MLIWLLAIVLLASIAALGYRQGAVRAGGSFLGICAGVLLALPLAAPMTIVLRAAGVTHPVLLWLPPVFLAFCLVAAVFKSAAFFAHRKIEMHFKYKAGDLRWSLWERLNARLGLCLGLLNGAAYWCLISFVIYIFGYWTVQMDTSSGNPLALRLFNRAAADLQKSGFSVTARAIERMPASFYEAADVAGLLYKNPLLEARLARYPAFLMLGERPEFRALADDHAFMDMRARQAGLAETLQHGPLQNIFNNPDMLREVWGVVEPNLEDLHGFLKTGLSEKYSAHPILGRWAFSPRGTAAAVRRARPTITSSEMRRVRIAVESAYASARLIIGLENETGRMVLRDFPTGRPPATPGGPLELQNGQGTWEGEGERYTLRFSLGEVEVSAPAAIEGERLVVTISGIPIVFEREH